MSFSLNASGLLSACNRMKNTHHTSWSKLKTGDKARTEEGRQKSKGFQVAQVDYRKMIRHTSQVINDGSPKRLHDTLVVSTILYFSLARSSLNSESGIGYTMPPALHLRRAIDMSVRPIKQYGGIKIIWSRSDLITTSGGLNNTILADQKTMSNRT